MPSRCCRQRSHWYGSNFKCSTVISIGMKKKRAEQVLQTTVSLIRFKLQMSDYNINRNEKKCGVTSFMVCNQVHCLQPGSGYATRFRVCNQVSAVQLGIWNLNHINETVVFNTCSARFFSFLLILQLDIFSLNLWHRNTVIPSNHNNTILLY